MSIVHRRSSSTCVAVGLAILCRPAIAGAPLDVEGYVGTVLRSHPAARQTAALEDAAVAEREARGRFPDPVLGFRWDRARPPVGEERSETGWSISQTLPWPGTLSARGRAAEGQAAALRAEATAARWELEIAARTAFARLLHARTAVEIARDAERDARSLKELTERRVSLGEAREIDRIKAEVEWLKQERARRSLEGDEGAAEAILRRLAVVPLPDPLVLSGELPSPFPAVDGEDLHARLAARNPELRAAEAASARETELLSVARRERVPDLDVTLFRESELDKTATGLAFGLRVPLWNANRGEVARAEAALTAAAASVERARLDLAVRLEHARRQLDVASAEAAILTAELLPAATRSLELARFSYEEGETSLLDLLDAQRTFRETEREAVGARLALALALADVRRLVGPDYEPGR